MCAAAIWIAYTRHPFKKYRVLGTLLAPGLAAVRQAGGDRPADLRRAAAGVWAVRGRGAADGPDLHERGGRAPDRAAGGGRSCTWCRSGSPLAASGAGRPGGGPPRCGGDAPRRLRGTRARRRVHGAHDADRRADAARHPARVPRHGGAAVRRDDRAGRDAAGAGRELLHHRRGSRPSAGGALRGLNDTRVPLAVLGLELLGASASSAATGWPFPWGSAPSASGSACRSAPPSTRRCWCGASIRSRRGTICRRCRGAG